MAKTRKKGVNIRICPLPQQPAAAAGVIIVQEAKFDTNFCLPVLFISSPDFNTASYAGCPLPTDMD